MASVMFAQIVLQQLMPEKMGFKVVNSATKAIVVMLTLIVIVILVKRIVAVLFGSLVPIPAVHDGALAVDTVVPPAPTSLAALAFVLMNACGDDSWVWQPHEVSLEVS